MAVYTAVPTVSTGDPWTASDHNTHVQQNFAYFKDECDDHHNRIRSAFSSAINIVSGAVTAFSSAGYSTYPINGESSADDELATINGGEAGDVITLRYNGNGEINLVETGNINLGDFGSTLLLLDWRSFVTLLYTGTKWELRHTNIQSSYRYLKKVGFKTLVDNGNSGTTKTIDWNSGNKQKVTLNGDCTFTFTAPLTIGNLTLELIGDATQRSLTWPATVIWIGVVGEPVWSGDNGNKNIASFFYDGTNYIASGGADNN